MFLYKSVNGFDSKELLDRESEFKKLKKEGFDLERIVKELNITSGDELMVVYSHHELSLESSYFFNGFYAEIDVKKGKNLVIKRLDSDNWRLFLKYDYIRDIITKK